MAVATSTAIALAATAVGTGISVYGQQQAAKQAEAAGKYNAKLAENEASQRELESHETIRRQRADKRRAMAQAKARLAVSGAALGEGTSVDVMEVLDARLETQVQDSARSAQLEARALRQQANLSRYQGRQQSAALKMQSFGTLLSGASSAAGMYSRASYNTNPN